MSELIERLLPNVRRYLMRRPDLAPPPIEIVSLAQGEYNVNFLVTAGGRRFVARLSTGSQEIATGPSPILYEAHALRALAHTGVSPGLIHVDEAPDSLPFGLLLEDYLEGRPLDYSRTGDVRAAAHTLAQLHGATLDDEARRSFTVVDGPISTYLRLGAGMLDRYRSFDRASAAVVRTFQAVERRLEALTRFETAVFAPALRRVVHTDVQAHNFIVAGDPAAVSARLVDWEKPVWDDPSYDVCHFLIRTTTRWKCAVDLSPDAQETFLTTYRHSLKSRDRAAPAGLDRRVALRCPFVYWRALTWCAMAWVDYQSPDRPIKNADTLARIEEYLQPAFLEACFATVLDGTLERSLSPARHTVSPSPPAKPSNGAPGSPADQ